MRTVRLCIYSFIINCLVFTLHGELKKGDNAVTFALNPGGRLGDDILCYCKAKWVAYEYGLPFVGKKFPYSDALTLHNSEGYMDDASIKKIFRTIVNVRGSFVPNFQKDAATLYVVHHNYVPSTWRSLYEIKDEIFRDHIKECLQPCSSLVIPSLPKDKKIIAVHVRRGGGFDAPLLSGSNVQKKEGMFADKRFPLRFPPDSYYLEQIKAMVDLVGPHVYVYIFTDDKNPQDIVARYSAALGNSAITFLCRQQDNRHDMNVLEDLFAMAQCDYLIRPESNYSLIAEFLGNHAVVIAPKHHYWVGTTLIIDQVSITIKNNEIKSLLESELK